MRPAFPRLSRPPIGTPLDASSQLQRGLIYFAPFWEGTGKVIHDVVQGNNAATIAGSPVWAPGVAGAVIGGFSCPTSASIKTGAVPTSQLPVWPVTIAVGCNVTAEQSATSIFGLYAGSNFAIAIEGGSTSGIGWAYLNGSSAVSANESNNITLGANVVASLTVTTSSQILYINGLQSHSTSNTAANPTYGTPVWWIGGGSTANVLFYWAAAWNRALTATEHQALATNIWQIFAPAYPAALFGAQPFGLPHVPILRPVSDRSGSRRLIWAE